mgnify:CR=1 FL=1
MNNEGGNMGDLDFSYEKYHLRRIREALKRRNLFMNPNNGWGIHGPHEGMNYQVYVKPDPVTVVPYVNGSN